MRHFRARVSPLCGPDLEFPSVEAVGRFPGQEAVVLSKPDAFFPHTDSVGIAARFTFVGDAELVAKWAGTERVALIVDVRRAW